MSLHIDAVARLLWLPGDITITKQPTKDEKMMIDLAEIKKMIRGNDAGSIYNETD